MVHKNDSEGSKTKARGRPFSKGHNKGKIDSDLPSSKGPEISVKGGIVGEDSGIELKLPKPALDAIENIINKIDEDKSEKIELELLESIDFFNGKNKLSVRFSRRHNRMYRVQIFLNDEHEVRPVTYAGANTGYTFWSLLKGAMKNNEKNSD